MSTQTVLSDEMNKIQEAQRQYRGLLESTALKLSESLVDILNNIDGLHRIQWSQYTPFFNDGDACIFSVCEIWFFTDKSIANALGEEHIKSVDDIDHTQWPEDIGGVCIWSHMFRQKDSFDAEKWNSREQLDACNQIKLFLEGSEDLLLAAFGDHVRVVVSPDGVTVEDIDHD